MMKRRPNVASLAGEFETLGVGRLTWLGLAIATIGWAVLISGTGMPDALAMKTARPLPASFHTDLIAIARGLIESGFALAIIGALQNGFGRLNRFFGAVLSRSGSRGGMVQPAKSAASIDGRPYRMFSDGSVEVDTIVGTRLFKTMAEAREFI